MICAAHTNAFPFNASEKAQPFSYVLTEKNVVETKRIMLLLIQTARFVQFILKLEQE